MHNFPPWKPQKVFVKLLNYGIRITLHAIVNHQGMFRAKVACMMSKCRLDCAKGLLVLPLNINLTNAFEIELIHISPGQSHLIKSIFCDWVVYHSSTIVQTPGSMTCTVTCDVITFCVVLQLRDVYKKEL
jgi:hypothetical protein